MKQILTALLFAALGAAADAAPLVLAWDANPASDGVVSYVVYEAVAKGAPIVVATSTTTTATLDAAPGPHTYYVTARNEWESAPSNSVSTNAQPGKPTGLKVALQVNVTVTLDGVPNAPPKP